MHDPFQSYANFGQHVGASPFGIPSPIGLPYAQMQNPGIGVTPLNPLLGLAQLAQTGGIPQMGQGLYGQTQGQVNPQQLLASLVANNPLLAASLLSNPLVAASLHAQQYGVQYPQIGAQLGQQIGNPFAQQIGNPFAQQIGNPFAQTGYPLAPQSWIGQGAQFGQRPFQAQGLSPWGY